MKKLILIIMLLSTTQVFATAELNFKENVSLKAVVMDDILLKDLSQLYSDFYFDEKLLADKENNSSKKNSTWNDNLRMKLNTKGGYSRI